MENTVRGAGEGLGRTAGVSQRGMLFRSSWSSQISFSSPAPVRPAKTTTRSRTESYAMPNSARGEGMGAIWVWVVQDVTLNRRRSLKLVVELAPPKTSTPRGVATPRSPYVRSVMPDGYAAMVSVQTLLLSVH